MTEDAAAVLRHGTDAILEVLDLLDGYGLVVEDYGPITEELNEIARQASDEGATNE
jgi:hypothetical protein